jgi:hypothetical protein
MASYVCGVCNVPVNSANRSIHEAGKKHRALAEGPVDARGAVAAARFESVRSVFAALSPTSAPYAGGRYVCPVCNVPVTTGNKASHEAGAKHRELAQAAEAQAAGRSVLAPPLPRPSTPSPPPPPGAVLRGGGGGDGVGGGGGRTALADFFLEKHGLALHRQHMRRHPNLRITYANLRYEARTPPVTPAHSQSHHWSPSLLASVL